MNVILRRGDFAVVHHPDRQQPYTIWQGAETVYFCDTFTEASAYVSSQNPSAA